MRSPTRIRARSPGRRLSTTHTTTTAAALTIGIDLGGRKSDICVLDAAVETAEEGRIATTPEAFRARFEGLVPTRVAVEVGRYSAWVSELLKGLGHEVLVANARRVRLIFQSDAKNDRLDAERLARLARFDGRLLCPIEHRNRCARAGTSAMRSREALVETRTRLVNHIHGVLKSFGLRVKEYAASSFHRHVEDEIPIELKSALRPLVKTLEGISECASGYDREIARLSTDVYPETALLNQVDRVGPITSLRCVLTIEDPGRIKKSRNVGAYLGLRPKQTTVWQARPGAANHEGR